MERDEIIKIQGEMNHDAEEGHMYEAGGAAERLGLAEWAIRFYVAGRYFNEAACVAEYSGREEDAIALWERELREIARADGTASQDTLSQRRMYRRILGHAAVYAERHGFPFKALELYEKGEYQNGIELAEMLGRHDVALQLKEDFARRGEVIQRDGSGGGASGVVYSIAELAASASGRGM